MPYKCDVCEAAEGSVFCFTDEAVLCSSCDCSVHGDTKSAEQHKRVSLAPSSDTALCDVCQERNAVLFCSEDRALICRECDLMIHTANAFVAKHHRYLLQFVQVGLQTLPLPGDNGRTEAGTSKRFRRSTHQPAATDTSAASGGTQTIFQGAAQPLQSTNPLLPHTAQAPQAQAAVAQPQQQPQLLQQQVQQQQQPQAVQQLKQESGFPHISSAGNLIDNSAGQQGTAPTGQLLSPFGATDQPGFGPSTSSAFGAAALGPFSFGSNQDLQGVTRASELLGNPSLAMGFTAKDIDAAYLFGNSGDLDADLSALLEVPDIFPSGGSQPSLPTGSQQPARPGASEPPKLLEPLAGDGVVPDLSGSKR